MSEFYFLKEKQSKKQHNLDIWCCMAVNWLVTDLKSEEDWCMDSSNVLGSVGISNFTSFDICQFVNNDQIANEEYQNSIYIFIYIYLKMVVVGPKKE